MNGTKESERSVSGAARRWVVIAIVLALPLLFALYANSLHGPFQFDDRHAIVENSLLRSAAVDWSWLGARAGAIGAGHYRPVTFITYAWNIRGGGLDPFGFHVVNVFLHWVATAVLAWLLWLVTRRATPAIVGAALFAVTPANSETVNYLAARSSLLVGLWSALSIAAFVVLRSAQLRGRRRIASAAGVAAFAALGLGLGSKEVAVVVPVIWLCYDIGWTRELRWSSRLAPYAVVLSVATAYLAATGYYRAVWNVVTGAPSDALGVWENLWTQLAVFPKHLTVFLWPFHLNVLYEIPTVGVPWRLPTVAGLALLLAIGAVAVRWVVTASDARKPVGFFLLWFVAALAPIMAYPLHIRFQEHRDYLAWMALAGVVGLSVAGLVDRLGRSPVARRVIVAGALVVMAVLATATWTRNAVWTDVLRLWSDTAAKSPNHPVARVNLGAEYAVRGDAERALAEYREAIRLSPEYVLPYYNAGIVYTAQEDYTRARAVFERAVALAPGAIDSLIALASTYEVLGERTQAAETLSRSVAALDRGRHHPEARVRVAEALAKSGRWADAAQQYQAVLAQEQARPSFLSARAYLGSGFLDERAGRPEQALAAYGEALKINPELHDARYNRANVLLSMGRIPEATAAYEELVVVEPTFFQARFNLGRLYERAGRLADARAQYQAFLGAAPISPMYDTARAYASSRLDVRPGGS